MPSRVPNETPGYADQVRGDFDGGGDVNAKDIDTLFAAIRISDNSPVFDLTWMVLSITTTLPSWCEMS